MASILPITNHLQQPRSPIYPASPTFHLHPTSRLPDVGSYGNGGQSGGRNAVARVPVIFRRLLKFQQMDFELAAWQMTWLCISPKRVYRNVYFHKVSPIMPCGFLIHKLTTPSFTHQQTKNIWARDDPAILILISTCLVVASIAWSFVHEYSLFQVVKLSLLMIFRDFLFVGALIATCLWFFSNKLLLQPPTHMTETGSRVEWAYAFDVHTNAFFPLFLSLYVAQLFLAPVITKSNWVCLWVGNTLYLAALAQYTYITYLGFNALPFLIRSELLLSPLLPLFAGYLISLLGFNVSKHVLGGYFG